MADAATKAQALQFLAANRFDQDISLAEEKLFDAASNGKEADCTSLLEGDRIIRGDRLSWLCTNPDASAQVTSRGVSIVGAQIDGELKLEWARISFPVRARRCSFQETIFLQKSRLVALLLLETSIKDLQADRVVVEYDVYLQNGFRAEGRVNFSGATIGGNLGCNDALFFSDSEAPALDAPGAKIQGSVFLMRSKAEGGVNFSGSTIGGYLICNHGEIVGKSEAPALDANSAKIQGSVYLRAGFKAKGGVDLAAATIGGHLVCDGSQFVNKGMEPALNGNGAQIQGDVLMGNGFEAEGGVDFSGAAMGGDMVCEGLFISKGMAPALAANGAAIRGSVYFRRGFEAEGGVNLKAAAIGGDLACDGGRFVSKSEAPALNADSVRIAGGVYFRRGTAAEGEVVFVFAYVTRDFQWTSLKSPEKALLDLRFTKVGTLFNAQDSWPSAGNLHLTGFVYDQIDDQAPPNAEVQLGWLYRQPLQRFLPQPFEQLAAALRKMGLEEDARKVMIAKNKDQAAHLQMHPAWLWYGLFGKLIGYGYRPWRVFCISAVLIGIGWLLFRDGYTSKIITPTDDKAYVETYGKRQLSENYPKFNAFIYSLETFVPLVKLGISEYWTPNANRGVPLNFGVIVSPRSGSLLRSYLWFHMITGWILTILWLGALTGLLKS
jgi:hypothetical protein